MDKFFIQAAFKTLDDIDKEENKNIKQALIESRLREKKKREKKYPLGKGEHLNTCAGDPDVNTAAFNHATSINNGSPTTSLGEAKEGKNYEVQRYGRWNFIIINPDNGLALRVGNNIDYSKPQSKDNKILFFKSKQAAENYIKDNLLDKEKLEEKIPKELKKAYQNNSKSLYASRLDYANPENIAINLGYSDSDIEYNESPIDFENAEYKIISKEEAHEYEKPRNRWHLILYYKDGVENSPQALRFDRTGKPLEKFNFYLWGNNRKKLPRDSKGSYINSSTLLPIYWLIENADIIYYTDELDHLNDKYFKDFKKEDDPNKDVRNILDFWDPSLTSDEKRARDTFHLDFDNMSEYEKRKQIIGSIKYFENKLDSGYSDAAKELFKKRIKLLKRLLYKNISPSEYETLKTILNNNPKRRNFPINLKLARAIALKNKLKKKIDIFKEKPPLAQEEKGYTSNWDYQYYNKQITQIEEQIKKLEKDIEFYKEKINSLDKDKLNRQVEDEVNKLGDEIEKIDKELTGYGLKSVFKESVDKTKFNLKDPEDIEEAKKIKDEEDSEEDLVIIHPMLNHKKPHPGDAIVTCKDCDEVFYLDKNELKQDPDDPDIYNKDLQCENCGAQNGYNYVGDVALKSTESAEEAIKERDASLEDDFESKDGDNDVKELEPIDDTEEPEEIMEESFDKLVNKYLNKIYENITSYKTSSITQTDRNSYLVEGIFKLNDNNKIKTSFLLEATEKKNNNITLKGSNEILAESKEPFEIKGKVDNKKLIFESFKYNYIETINDNQYLVEGLEENN